MQSKSMVPLYDENDLLTSTLPATAAGNACNLLISNIRQDWPNIPIGYTEIVSVSGYFCDRNNSAGKF